MHASLMEREPILKGTFYPDDEQALSAEVGELLGLAQSSEPALAAIVPHGALSRSGRVAAAVFQRFAVPDVVIVLSATHAGHETRGAIMTHGMFKIPTARVPVDTRLAEDLRAHALLTDDAHAHLFEPAIEAQLPFLVKRNPRVRIVPVVFGPMPHASCVRVGHAIADCLHNHAGNVLVLATATLSSYVPAQGIRERDQPVIDRITALDAPGLYDLAVQSPDAMSGAIPVSITLSMARALGRTEATLLEHGYGGDPGDDARVAGYASFVIR
jgi:AmmeMemoRadiSam system protein B